MVVSTFSFAYYPPACHLWKNVYLGLRPSFYSDCLFVCLFIFMMLSCMSSVDVLDINPLFTISFANMFSHSVVCLFVLWMVSFAIQKLLSLIRSHLFLFAFMSFALENRSKTIALCQCQNLIYVRECSAYVFM